MGPSGHLIDKERERAPQSHRVCSLSRSCIRMGFPKGDCLQTTEPSFHTQAAKLISMNILLAGDSMGVSSLPSLNTVINSMETPSPPEIMRVGLTMEHSLAAGLQGNYPRVWRPWITGDQLRLLQHSTAKERVLAQKIGGSNTMETSV